MPDSKEGQKKLSLLELNIVTMQADVKNLGTKLDEICKKIDSLSANMEQWKMQGHDNSRDIADIKLDVAKMQLKEDTMAKGIEKGADNFGKVKSYIAGGVAVLGFVLTMAMYLIDKFF